MARTGRRWSRALCARAMRSIWSMASSPSAGPREVALSLKGSAERSERRKSAPFRSAMSMLNFHINRAGKGLSKSQKSVLERAKGELRKLYGRDPARSGRRYHAGKAHHRARAKKRARR
jgi:Protein of unknown function (DUF3175)